MQSDGKIEVVTQLSAALRSWLAQCLPTILKSKICNESSKLQVRGWDRGIFSVLNFQYSLLYLRHPRKGCVVDGHITHNAFHRSCMDVYTTWVHKTVSAYCELRNYHELCRPWCCATTSCLVLAWCHRLILPAFQSCPKSRLFRELNIVRCSIVHIYCLFVFSEIK